MLPKVSNDMRGHSVGLVSRPIVNEEDNSLRTTFLKAAPVVVSTVASLFCASALPTFAQNAAPATPATPAPAPATTPASPATPTTPTAAAAATAPPPPNYNIQYNGLLDGYYMLQFNNPKGSGILPGDRAYDVRQDTPTLALAELNVYQNAKPGGLGFHATFQAGDVTDINHGGIGVSGDTEPRYKSVQQLYGTYAFAGAGGGVDFGEFYTPFGYEVVEANGNYNYSRSLPFTIVPTYHFGFRAYTPSYKGFVFTGYLVNAIYNTTTAGIHDDNGTPAYIGSIAYTDPAGKYNAVSSLAGGKDKVGSVLVGTSTNSKIILSNTAFTYNFTPNILGGLEYTYLKVTPDGGLGDVKTNGYAVYYKQNLTAKTDYALRFSGYQQKATGVADSKPYEFTATYEVRPAANFTTRFEYRHDTVNSGNGLGIAFAGKDVGTTKNSQDTILVAGMFTF